MAECVFNGGHGVAYVHAGVRIAAAIRALPPAGPPRDGGGA
jgi:hypothetical protein